MHSKFRILALFCVGLAWQAAANEGEGYRELDYEGPFRARVERVFEGDHFELIYGTSFDNTIRLRLSNANTPSPFSDKRCEKEAGILVRDYVRELVRKKQVKLYNLRRGRQSFETVGRIEIDRQDLGEHLIQKGYAVRYHDSYRNPERRSWPCEDLPEKPDESG